MESEAFNQVKALVSKESYSFDEMVSYINRLVNTDFNRLISILRRIDVSEKRVRESLAENPNNHLAGELILNLIIERQLQKIESRKKYSGF